MNVSHLTKLCKRFLKSLDDRQRKVFYAVACSFAVLLVGGVVLLFTKDPNAPPEQKAVKLTCSDSDGYDIHKKGAVTYTDAGGRHVDEDYCDLAEKSVYEMSCRKDSFFSPSAFPEKKTVACGNGCINGACVR